MCCCRSHADGAARRARHRRCPRVSSRRCAYVCTSFLSRGVLFVRRERRNAPPSYALMFTGRCLCVCARAAFDLGAMAIIVACGSCWNERCVRICTNHVGAVASGGEHGRRCDISLVRAHFLSSVRIFGRARSCSFAQYSPPARRPALGWLMRSSHHHRTGSAVHLSPYAFVALSHPPSTPASADCCRLTLSFRPIQCL